MQAWGVPEGGSAMRGRMTADAMQLAEEQRMAMQATSDGVLEVLSPFHWWCRSCGRWEVCDDADLCRECAWMRAHRRTPAPGRAPRKASGDGSTGADAK